MIDEADMILEANFEEEVTVTYQTQSNYNGEEVCECDACVDEDDDSGDAEEAEFDKGSCSKMLRRVSLSKARLYGQMSHLGNLAYDISKTKPGKLLKRYGLPLVTSSREDRNLHQKKQGGVLEKCLV